ncbi:hypothetical protein BDD12DRAFT_32836 [Trichophaea hybrida]|nr:hypothetical protein BDD12DRAFT_32836 [Trichophaea hybrida]
MPQFTSRFHTLRPPVPAICPCVFTVLSPRLFLRPGLSPCLVLRRRILHRRPLATYLVYAGVYRLHRRRVPVRPVVHTPASAIFTSALSSNHLLPPPTSILPLPSSRLPPSPPCNEVADSDSNKSNSSVWDLAPRDEDDGDVDRDDASTD